MSVLHSDVEAWRRALRQAEYALAKDEEQWQKALAQQQASIDALRREHNMLQEELLLGAKVSPHWPRVYTRGVVGETAMRPSRADQLPARPAQVAFSAPTSSQHDRILELEDLVHTYESKVRAAVRSGGGQYCRGPYAPPIRPSARSAAAYHQHTRLCYLG